MAEIPVERKSGAPWLWYMLGLLGLLALAVLLMRGCNTDRAAVVNTSNENTNSNINRANTNAGVVGTSNTNAGSTLTTTGAGAATTNTGTDVTDVNLFGSTADKASLAGRRVNLTNVRVARVLSDRVFTVTSGSGEMFVMLDENLDTGGGREQQIKARPGQTVNLGGSFRNVPSAETSEERQGRALDAREYAQMKGQQIYLHATDVRNAG